MRIEVIKVINVDCFALFQAREMLSSSSIENPSNDDRILQCCLLFQRKGIIRINCQMLLYLHLSSA